MNNIPMLASLIKPRDIKIEDKYDKILKAYLTRTTDKLPEDLKQCLVRWKKIYDMFSQGELVQMGEKEFYKPYKFNQIITFISETYKVSIRTARDDIKSAKRFYAVPDTKVDNDFARGIFLEKLEEKSAICAGLGDYITSAMYDKMIITMQQWDKPPVEEVAKYAELELPYFSLVADPSELGFAKLDDPEAAVKRVLAKRKKGKMDNIFAEAETVEIITRKYDGAEDLAK